MKVIIDTNVFISAVWRDRNPEAVVLWICDQPDWQWTVSKRSKRNTGSFAAKKFSFTPSVLEEWSQVIEENTTEVETDENINLHATKDEKFWLVRFPVKRIT